MSSCPQCGAKLPPDAHSCEACGAKVMSNEASGDRASTNQASTNQNSTSQTSANQAPTSQAQTNPASTSAIFTHVPHPYIAKRKHKAPVVIADMLPHESAMQRFNAFLALRITGAVGTMWCAYLFALLAFISLPEAVRGGTGTLIAWIAQTFLQLVLLSIIIVGQKVSGEASDKRALDTYNDAEAVLHEAMQIQEHLAAQDKVLTKLIDALSRPAGKTG